VPWVEGVLLSSIIESVVARCRLGLACGAAVIFLCWAPAASAGELVAGLAAYQNGDYARALAEFQPLADDGDITAQYYMGELYLKGQGVPQDFEKAVEWFALAAEYGHGHAQANLGALLTLGLGTRRDLETAYYWQILSVVWTDTALRRAAFRSLSEVAPQLTEDEKGTLGAAADEAWSLR